MPNIHTMHK